jgi:hypothetical protein
MKNFLFFLAPAVATVAVAAVAGCGKTIHVENQGDDDAPKGVRIY